LGDSEFDEPKALMNSMPPRIKIEGRAKEQMDLIEKLTPRQNNSTRLVTMMGFPGLGKTALVTSALYYIQERAIFNGGCIYVDGREIEQVKDFEEKLINVIIND
jgi:Ni2+-binding GTPase involved in maturation of urease and hydrogenase